MARPSPFARRSAPGCTADLPVVIVAACTGRITPVALASPPRRARTCVDARAELDDDALYEQTGGTRSSVRAVLDDDPEAADALAQTSSRRRRDRGPFAYRSCCRRRSSHSAFLPR